MSVLLFCKDSFVSSPCMNYYIWDNPSVLYQDSCLQYCFSPRPLCAISLHILGLYQAFIFHSCPHIHSGSLLFNQKFKIWSKGYTFMIKNPTFPSQKDQTIMLVVVMKTEEVTESHRAQSA